MDFTPLAKPIVATELVNQIYGAIAKDEGATYRQLLRKWIAQAEDAYRGKEHPFKKRLGASTIGERCERLIWYSWHWAVREQMPPRLLLLLNRGHLEEARFSALLELIGVPLQTKDANGKQYAINLLDANYGGSCDGLAVWPVGGYHIVAELKTHNRSSFEDLAGDLKEWRAHCEGRGAFTGKGVRASKYKHYVQAHVYRSGFGCDGALYMAICKDTDDLYAEWLPMDPATPDEALRKAERVIYGKEIPAKINASPGWYGCKFCKAKGICHLGQQAERNCRTCKHGRTMDHGYWLCGLHSSAAVPLLLDEDQQLIGCPEHSYLPGL
jgi:hypothetical protein